MLPYMGDLGQNKSGFLRTVEVREPQRGRFPFDVPTVAALSGLPLEPDPDVTVIVGRVGKPTLLDAIASGFPASRGSWGSSRRSLLSRPFVFKLVFLWHPHKPRVCTFQKADRMPNNPYHIARQEHLGDMLDHLRDLGLLAWEWGYENRRAIFWVTKTGQTRRKLDTKRAEDLALNLCKQQGIVWLPVPHPGGESQLTETLRKMEEIKQVNRSNGSSTRT
jgi:hypothetical protein